MSPPVPHHVGFRNRLSSLHRDVRQQKSRKATYVAVRGHCTEKVGHILYFPFSPKIYTSPQREKEILLWTLLTSPIPRKLYKPPKSSVLLPLPQEKTTNTLSSQTLLYPISLFQTTMKISYASIMILLSMTALAVPNPEADSQDRSAHGLNMLEARKGCSGTRQPGDKCTGRRLGEMNSFHGWSDINLPPHDVQ